MIKYFYIVSPYSDENTMYVYKIYPNGFDADSGHFYCINKGVFSSVV